MTPLTASLLGGFIGSVAGGLIGGQISKGWGWGLSLAGGFVGGYVGNSLGTPSSLGTGGSAILAKGPSSGVNANQTVDVTLTPGPPPSSSGATSIGTVPIQSELLVAATPVTVNFSLPQGATWISFTDTSGVALSGVNVPQGQGGTVAVTYQGTPGVAPTATWLYANWIDASGNMQQTEITV